MSLIRVEHWQYGQWVGYTSRPFSLLSRLDFRVTTKGVDHFDNDGNVYRIV